MSTLADLRTLRDRPWPVALLLLLLAVAVLAVRIAGLLLWIAVDMAERVETAVSTAAGTVPLGTAVQLHPVPVPGWTPPGGEW